MKNNDNKEHKRVLSDEDKERLIELSEAMSLSGCIDYRSSWQKFKDRLLGR